ncbi:MAG: hypothetical protein ACTSPO_15250 [Candidatus Heimdallarchaeaceae archaeon]
MPEEKKEGIQDAPDEESKKIMDEIESEKDSEEDKPEVEEKPKEESQKKEEDKPKEEEEKEEKEEEEKEKKEEEKEEKEGRVPKTMPIWKHKIAEKKYEEKIDKLQLELEEATKKSTPVQADKIKEISDKYGLEEGMIKDLIGIVGGQKGLDKDSKDRISKLEKDLADTKEDRIFDQEFKKDILSLDDVKEGDQAEVKKLLKDLAFTEEFAKVPLKRIWRFEEFDKFRGESKGKKSAESSAGGDDNWTKDDIKNASGADFDKYCEYMEKKQPKFTIHRDGKIVK